jgi:hypothetical protein
METAVANLALSKRNTIELIGGIDFTGVERTNFFNEYVQLLKNKSSVSEIIQYIDNFRLKLSNQYIVDCFKERFSLVVSAPVYTQMFFPCAQAFLEVSENYSNQEMEKISYKLSELNDCTIIPQYNDMLTNLVEDNGRIFVWSDQFEFTSRNKKLLLLTEEYLNSKDIGSLYKILMNYKGGPGPIGGGFYGISDLSSRMNDDDRILNCWLWDFDSNKTYFTTGVEGSVKK